MRKYLVQILVVLILLGSAWGLFLLGGTEEKKENITDNIREEASIQQSVRLPINQEIIPIRNWSIKEPEIFAESAIVVNFGNNNEQAILFQKNTDQVLPIASLTKIMTAVIVLENFDLEEIVKVSKDSILTMGDEGGLIRGEELTIRDLLYIMLIESSNDAGMALANDNSDFSYQEFLDLMNQKAREIGMENTEFLDPIGLNSKNKSTVLDLVKLADSALEFPLLWDILKTPAATIYSIDNQFVHNLINTNTLLDKFSFLKGGKTGYTVEANGCMLTVSNINGSLGNNYLITVVLGSNQRETDTESLITWAQKAYVW